MDSIKRKCRNWIVYFKKIANFHLIHLIKEKLDVFNFHPFFSIVITHVRDLNMFFLKKYIKSGNIEEEKNKTSKDF